MREQQEAASGVEGRDDAHLRDEANLAKIQDVNLGATTPVDEALALVRRSLALEFADVDVGHSAETAASDATSETQIHEAAVDHLIRHRVVGLVLTHADDLGLPTAVRGRLRRRWQYEAQRTLAVQQAAITLTEGLMDAGLPCLVYKGVALAAMTTDNATIRGASDLDLLVAPDDMPAVYSWLLEHGAEFLAGKCPPPTSELWSYARQLNCELSLIWRGVAIDLHWRIDQLPQVFSTSFEELWARRSEVIIAGRPLATLGPVDAFLVTCAHGTKEHWRHWRWVVDLVRQVRTVEDWSEVQQRARESGCAPAVEIAFAVHEHLVPLPPGAPGPGPRSRALADRAWIRARDGAAPFDGNSLGDQRDRLRWTARTLPSAGAAGSMIVRLIWTTHDMAEAPMPRGLVWAYPFVRYYLWARRLITAGRRQPAGE